jgi:hypothetical protein
MCERSFVRVPGRGRRGLAGELEGKGIAQLRLTSWSFDGDDSRPDLDLDVLWDLQELVREDVPHLGRLLEGRGVDGAEGVDDSDLCLRLGFSEVVGELARN